MPISNINQSGSFRDILLKKNLIITKDGNNDWKNYDNQLKDGDKIGQPIDYFSNEGDIKNSYYLSSSKEILNDVISIGNFIINSKAEGSLSNNKFYYLSNDDKKEYLDGNGKLNVGGPSTEPYNIVSSFLNGQGGVGFGSKGLVTNNDIRNTLAGRALASKGLINDSQIGKIGGQQLAIQLGNNALFHLQKETIGKINTDVWALFDNKKDKFIKPNYDITVPNGAIGKTVDFLADLGGFSLPRSQMDVDLYSFDDKFSFTKRNNIERANDMLKNTGNGQVMALMDNLNASILSASNSNSKLSYRQGYAPPFIKGKKQVDEPNIYAYGISYSELKTLSEPETFDKGPLDDWKSSDGSGFDMDYHNDGKFVNNESNNTISDFTWYGSEYNNNIPDNSLTLQDKVIGLSPEDNPETLFMKVAHRKSLLYKTKELFKNNKIASLTSGHGVKGAKNEQIQNIPSLNDKSVGYMSKGSGVLSPAYIDNPNNVTKAEDIFCRTWSPNDQYNEVRDQIKNDAIYSFVKNGNGKIGYIRNTDLISESVLDDTGHVKIPLYDYEKDSSTNVKRYMFSIENLAWLDNTNNIVGCELGPHGGRIMWFPPYDMSFSESVSVNWDKNQFIGRGEPLYTYNNTERTGSLSFKLIMDYPSEYDCLKNNGDITNEIFASIAAGCHNEEGILKYLTECEIADFKEVIPEKEDKEEQSKEYEPPRLNGKDKFYIFFPNDVHSDYINNPKFFYYESGLYDYTNKKIINPFDENYIEEKTVGDLKYKDWKDEYKINYTYKKTQSTVEDKDGDTINMLDDGKPTYFGLSYDDDGNNIFTVCKNGGIPRQRGEKNPKCYIDVNYGLNGWRSDGDSSNITLPSGDDANGFKCSVPDCKYRGWTHPQFLIDLAKFLSINYTVKIYILGNASISGEASRNITLTNERANAIKNLLIKKLPELVKSCSECKDKLNNIEKRIVIREMSEEEKKGNDKYKDYDYLSVNCDNSDKHQYYLGCKINRRSQIFLQHDPNLMKNKGKSNSKPTPIKSRANQDLSEKIKRRIYTECDHFKKLEKTDKFTFDKIKEKLLYFSPAFHSITPEGFNSRLTFLHQCTRQGMTNNVDRPDNLAFGRPPVCILRIGDFFYTKIVIESMSIDYEPLVWDLNPEGVGVQPMIANVTLNFAFIGGSSLNGPIKKLQNALSFNYYANTGIFDGRADTGNKTEEPKPEPDGGYEKESEIIVDNYILDKDAAAKLRDDNDSIEKLKLTAEYDIKINRSKITDDGFRFTIEPLQALFYDYTVKIYLVGKDINGKDIKEDLGIKNNELLAGQKQLETTSEKIKPSKGYDDIKNDRKDDNHKWGSVLDNLEPFDGHLPPEYIKEYVEGLSKNDDDKITVLNSNHLQLNPNVYKIINEKEQDKAHIICDKKDNITYYTRINPFDNLDNPNIVIGKYTKFEFEIEFTKNNKIFKSVRKPYYWDSTYKPSKLDICKPKHRIKVRTGNEEKWVITQFYIQEVKKINPFGGTVYTNPTDLLDDLDTYSELEYIETRYYEMGILTFNNFINKLENKIYITTANSNDEIKPNLTGDKSYVISVVKKYTNIPYNQILDENVANINTLVNNNISSIYIDDYNKYSLYYLNGDEINEENRIIYSGFNSGLDTTKTQLMITEGTITPTTKQ